MDIYVQMDGQQRGPFSESTIREGIKAGRFRPKDLATIHGTGSWQPLAGLLAVIEAVKVQAQPTASILENKTGSSATQIITSETSRTEKNTEPAAEVKDNPMDQRTRMLFPDVRQPTTVESAGGKHICRRCGSPYNVWSLFRGIGSGLCTDCTKATAKPKQPAIHERPIETRDDALKVVRITTALYMGLALLDFFIGNVPSGIIVGLCSVGIWLYHSRIASTALMILVILDYILFFVGGGMHNNPFARLWLTVGAFQLVLTFKAIEATYKLQQERSEGDSLRPELTTRFPIPSPKVYLGVATLGILVAVGIFLFDTSQNKATSEDEANSAMPDSFTPSTPWRSSNQSRLQPEEEKEFSVEKHRHMFDPTPTPSRFTPYR